MNCKYKGEGLLQIFKIFWLEQNGLSNFQILGSGENAKIRLVTLIGFLAFRICIDIGWLQFNSHLPCKFWISIE